MADIIYEDLMAQGDLGLTIHNLETKNKQLQRHVASLEEDIQKLCDKIIEMKRTQENLSRNISELFKTSRNEIDRKNRLIAELQSKIDDMVFKRNTAPCNFGFKRHREEKLPEENVKRPKFQSENFHSNDVELTLKKSEGTNKQSEANQLQNSAKFKDGDKKRENNYQVGYGDPGRFDKERRNRSDSKESGSRRESDRHRYSTDNDRSSREYRGRERRSSKYNSRSNYRDNDKIDKENLSKNREHQTYHRISPAELTHTSSEIIAVENDVLNESREEGEVSDNDNDLKTKSNLSRKDLLGYNEKTYSTEQNNDSNRKPNLIYPKTMTDNHEVASCAAQYEDSKAKPKSSNTKNLEKAFSNEQTNDCKKTHSIISKNVSDNQDKPRIEQHEDISKEKHKPSSTKNMHGNFRKTSNLIITKNLSNKHEKPPFPELKDNPRNDKIMLLDVPKFIENQQVMNKNKEIRIKKNKGTATSIDINSTKKKQDKIQERREKEPEETEIILKTSAEEIKKETNINIHKKKKNDSSTEITAKGIVTKTNQEINEQEKASCKLKSNEFQERKTQIQGKNTQSILQEGSAAEIIEKDYLKSKCDENLVVPIQKRINTPDCELRVPRNLTSELNIEKSKILETSKSSETIHKKLSSLFDTPIKNPNLVSPKHKLPYYEPLQLTHEGNIPLLQFDNKSNSKEASSNQSIIDIKDTSTPVTEFQIFKTNLPGLDKSNSLSSVGIQFHTPDSTNIKTLVEPQKGQIQKTESEIPVTDVVPIVNVDKSPTDLKEGIKSSVPKSIRNVGSVNSNDACKIGLELLRMDLDQYKVEDYPNLSAHCESKDMPDLLNSPLKVPKNQKVEKEEISSLKKQSETKTSQAPETDKEKENIDVDNVNVEEKVGNVLTLSISPSTGESRKKRRRCVISWAE